MRGVQRRSIQADLEAPDMLSRRFDLIKDRLIAENAKGASQPDPPTVACSSCRPADR